MTKYNLNKKGLFAAALITALSSTSLTTTAIAAPAGSSSATSDKTIVLSVGRGQQINLPSAISDVVVSNPAVATVDVRTSKQIYVFAKAAGETTVYATDASGRTVYKATFRVGGNYDSINEMLNLAMPEADITATVMNGTVLLTGTVAQPEDAEEAERLVMAFSEGSKVISRLKNATPLQVNLQVRIAEVSRSLAKEISSNIKTQDDGSSGGIAGIIGRGRDAADFVKATAATTTTPATAGGTVFKVPSGTNVIALAGRLFGLDVAAAFDLSEKAGLLSTLANPNLTTVSGETADFLVGGSFPIATSSNNGVSIDYKKYGVSLTYTPTVLSDGRISLRVRTEVSDISTQGAIRINGLEVPATTSRMAETTVELGSGQSMMIGGLLKNEIGSSVDKIPGAGDIPILGALFKSNGWKRNETELMIVVTPYLVKPVSDSEIKLPTDGIHTPNDLERILLGKTTSAKGSNVRPMPSVSPDAPAGPDFASVSMAEPASSKSGKSKPAKASDEPGFSF